MVHMYIIKIPTQPKTLPESRTYGKYIMNYIPLPRRPPAPSTPAPLGYCVLVGKCTTHLEKNAEKLQDDYRYRFPKQKRLKKLN